MARMTRSKKREAILANQSQKKKRVHSRLGNGSWLAWLVALSLVCPIQSACHVDDRWSDFSGECTTDGLPMAFLISHGLGMITRGYTIAPKHLQRNYADYARCFNAFCSSSYATRHDSRRMVWLHSGNVQCSHHYKHGALDFGCSRGHAVARVFYWSKLGAAKLETVKPWIFQVSKNPCTHLSKHEKVARTMDGVKGLRGLGNKWRTSPCPTAVSNDCLGFQ